MTEQIMIISRNRVIQPVNKTENYLTIFAIFNVQVFLVWKDFNGRKTLLNLITSAANDVTWPFSLLLKTKKDQTILSNSEF